MGSFFKQFGLYTLFLAIGGGAGLAGGYYLNPENRGVSPEVSPSAIASPAEQPRQVSTVRVFERNNPNFIADAVEKVGPAVVRIDSSRTVASRVPDAFSNPLFRRFFGDEVPTPQDQQVERGTGSGFIISADGQVITNAHVVDRAERVTVTLKDGRTFDGEVVGTDPVTDVAAIKISAADLPTVTFGSSRDLIPGQWAIAIGNPLGLDNTVTAGIISATGRSSSQVGVPDRRVQFIQTDAAINPGNSGGPLLNDQGEVIGINTAIRANAQGLGFAIPIETGQRIADQLFSTGRVEHPYLGIRMVDLTPEIKEQLNQDAQLELNITADQGILIVQVMPGAPAATGGLQAGDIIVKVNQKAVTNSAEVQEQVESSRIGEALMIEVNRNGQTQVIEVRPSAFPVDQMG
jgi:S1-C subfamily serine protease